PDENMLLEFIYESQATFLVEDTARYYNIFDAYSYDKSGYNDTIAAHLQFARSSLYFQVSLYPLALSNYRKSLEWYRKLGYDEMIAFCYYYLSRLHRNSPQEFFDYAQQGYEHFAPLPANGRKCAVISNKAFAHLRKNEKDSALKYYYEYYNVAKSINHPWHLPQAMGKIGNHYYHRKKESLKDSVRKYFYLQWEYAQLDASQKSMMNAAKDMAILARDEGRYEESLAYFEQALKLAERYNQVFEIRTFKRRIAQVYRRMGDFEKALEKAVEFYSYRDSIRKKENEVEIAALEKKYETKKKEAEIATLQRDKAKRDVVIYLVVSFMMMTVVIALILWRNNQLKKKINLALTSKNSELEKSFASIREQKNQIQHQKDRIELLLKEIHHRTKNNLQLVSSLLNLQMSEIDHPLVFEAMLKNKNQLNSMALIHQKLYRDDNLTSIAMKDYLLTLCEETKSTFGLKAEHIQLICSFEDLELDIDTAIPIGLIVNELVTNALKHAFSGKQEGTINIGLRRTGSNQFYLTVNDDGVGLSGSELISEGKNIGFGSRLINLLTLYLNGKMDISNQQGTTIEIQFESLKPKAA
ncbi:MAG: histidine kinase dimerization/phosphoacceptor domain -containing protein, partial [Bacteroidota bacterium]